jgi:hypothetical protein
MVFGTMTADPNVALGDGGGSLLGNGVNDHFNDRQGGAKSPVDLPLRLDDATVSPTTPQGQHQQALIYETEKELRLGRRTSEATGARLVRQRSASREHSPMRQYGFLSRLPRYTLRLFTKDVLAVG